MRLSYKQSLQALHLFSTYKSHQFRWEWNFGSLNRGPSIAQPQRQTSCYERAMPHLVESPENLPERMIANGVVLSPSFELGHQSTLESRAHLTMMQANLVGERSGLPAVQARRKDSNMVNAATFQRHVATDGFKAVAPKELTASPDILDVCEAIVVLKSSFSKRCARYTEVCCRRHLSQKKLEMLGLERDVCIQITDDIELKFSKQCVTGIEGVHLSSKVPLLTFRHAQQFNPRVFGRVLAHNLICSVRRAVANDNPLKRKMGLRNHRRDRQLDVLLFVPSRSNDHVV